MKQKRRWIDAQGVEVPAAYVPAYDKKRDAIARRIHARFERARQLLEQVYAESAADIEELERLALDGGKPVGGARGNLQFMSFDGLIRVERNARYEVQFDERLQQARQIISRVIDEKADGVDADFAEAVRQVFSPTSSGMLSSSRVLGLLKWRIRHPDWQRAMDLIKESINTRRGKTLIGVAEKSTLDGEWAPIILDLAKCAGLRLPLLEGGTE